MTNLSTDLHDVEKIIVLDYGSQYNQLISRRIREIGVFSELKSHKISADEVRAINPVGIVLSGGPNSVYEEGSFDIDPEIFELGIPILGICYGMQLLTHKLGGKVVPAGDAGNREYGQSELNLTESSALFAGTPDKQLVLMSHGDAVTEIPADFVRTGTSADCPFASIENPDKKIYGIQFHPEVRHSVHGYDILRNFALNICGAKGDWTMDNFIEMQIKQIREKVGDKRVLLGLSGGVDSSVCAVLLNKAIGKNLTCIFVDHGMLRKNEFTKVMEAYKGLGLNVIGVDASEQFFKDLEGVTDPEQKRKIIGRDFVEVFNAEAKKITDAKWLAQGTIYPDRIESLSITGMVIKSHHNVGGLPEEMHLQLCEPLRWLFKDEVRRVGYELGMPERLIKRHPFPGPGLAVRILGDITRDKVRILQDADDIYIEKMHNYTMPDGTSLYDHVWQAGTVLLSTIRSVGVMGDERTYEHPVALRAVTSMDAMTADWAHLPYDFMADVSNEIIRKVKGVNRVCYDISSKPPSTIEWE